MRKCRHNSRGNSGSVSGSVFALTMGKPMSICECVHNLKQDIDVDIAAHQSAGIHLIFIASKPRKSSAKTEERKKLMSSSTNAQKFFIQHFDRVKCMPSPYHHHIYALPFEHQLTEFQFQLWAILIWCVCKTLFQARSLINLLLYFTIAIYFNILFNFVNWNFFVVILLSTNSKSKWICMKTLSQNCPQRMDANVMHLRHIDTEKEEEERVRKRDWKEL